MQSLDVISLNIWHILISLCNLLIMFLILKRFLYQPVRRVMKERAEALGRQYDMAEQAQREAEAGRAEWEEKMRTADKEALRVIKKAELQAEHRCERIEAEAKKKAAAIIDEAREQAAAEQKKAQAALKKELADVSAVMTEVILKRELKLDDHRTAIDRVIAEMGDQND